MPDRCCRRHRHHGRVSEPVPMPGCHHRHRCAVRRLPRSETVQGRHRQYRDRWWQLVQAMEQELSHDRRHYRLAASVPATVRRRAAWPQAKASVMDSMMEKAMATGEATVTASAPAWLSVAAWAKAMDAVLDVGSVSGSGWASVLGAA